MDSIVYRILRRKEVFMSKDPNDKARQAELNKLQKDLGGVTNKKISEVMKDYKPGMPPSKKNQEALEALEAKKTKEKEMSRLNNELGGLSSEKISDFMRQYKAPRPGAGQKPPSAEHRLSDDMKNTIENVKKTIGGTKPKDLEPVQANLKKFDQEVQKSQNIEQLKEATKNLAKTSAQSNDPTAQKVGEKVAASVSKQIDSQKKPGFFQKLKNAISSFVNKIKETVGISKSVSKTASKIKENLSQTRSSAGPSRIKPSPTPNKNQVRGNSMNR